MRLGMLWALFVASIKMFIRNRAAVFFSLVLPLLQFGAPLYQGLREALLELGRSQVRVQNTVLRQRDLARFLAGHDHERVGAFG
jgi:hypothetical protein